jgi:hypothetical protein
MPIDLSFHTIPLDILYILSFGNHVQFGIGPSFAGNFRKVTIHYIDYDASEDELVDRLFGIGVGVGGSLQLSFPFFSVPRTSFVSNIRLRYIRSIIFDKNGRDVSDYDQEYIQAQVSAGLAFAF